MGDGFLVRGQWRGLNSGGATREMGTRHDHQRHAIAGEIDVGIRQSHGFFLRGHSDGDPPFTIPYQSPVEVVVVEVVFGAQPAVKRFELQVESPVAGALEVGLDVSE